jgi:hypothetical protein
MRRRGGYDQGVSQRREVTPDHRGSGGYKVIGQKRNGTKASVPFRLLKIHLAIAASGDIGPQHLLAASTQAWTGLDAERNISVRRVIRRMRDPWQVV